MKRSSSLRLTLWPMPWISVTSVAIVRPLSSPRKPSASGGSLREPGGAHRCASLRDCYPPGPPSSPRKPSASGGSLREPGGAHRCASLRDCYPPGPPSSPRKPSASGGSLREPGGAHRCASLRDCYPPGPPSSPRKPSASGGSLREPGGAHRCASLRDCYPPGPPSARRGRGRLLGSHGLSRGLDRLHDVHVAGTPADVAGDSPTNLLLGGLRISIQQRGTGQHHGWSAKPALETVF